MNADSTAVAWIATRNGPRSGYRARATDNREESSNVR